MIKKALAKAVAGTAAAGLVLVPSAVLAGPQFTNVACDYPDSVATTTDLRLKAVAAPYGTQNTAYVEVNSGTGTPQGKVRLRVIRKASYLLTLNENGEVTKDLPRSLEAGNTYRVKAAYKGKCDWKNSNDVVNYTVKKARVNVNPKVLNGKKAKFEASFRGNGGLDPQVGNAKFIVKKNGNTVRRNKVSVANGYARINMKNLKRGNYTLRVRYTGSPNFKKSRDDIAFSVGRGN